MHWSSSSPPLREPLHPAHPLPAAVAGLAAPCPPPSSARAGRTPPVVELRVRRPPLSSARARGRSSCSTGAPTRPCRQIRRALVAAPPSPSAQGPPSAAAPGSRCLHRQDLRVPRFPVFPELRARRLPPPAPPSSTRAGRASTAPPRVHLASLEASPPPLLPPHQAPAPRRSSRPRGPSACPARPLRRDGRPSRGATARLPHLPRAACPGRTSRRFNRTGARILLPDGRGKEAERGRGA